MEQHVSWISQVVNHFLGGIALALLSALHIQPSHPEMPIPEHVCMGFFVLVAGTLLALLVRSQLSVERPGAAQQVAEILLTNKEGFGINDILSENAGHHWRDYVPMVGTISLFISTGCHTSYTLAAIAAAPKANKPSTMLTRGIPRTLKITYTMNAINP